MNNSDDNTALEEKRTAAVQKTLSRLTAVSFCYNKILLGKESQPEKILTTLHSFNMENSPKANSRYYELLIKAIKFHYLEAQIAAEQFLVNGRSFNQLNKVYQAILITAGCEFKECDQTPTKVIINEYTNIASSFGDELITGFINAVLDKLSKILRNNTK